MAILNRKDLKSKFANGNIPTHKDFCDLIESSLNRTDDNFFGQWRPNAQYCEGDVVIHGCTLFMLKMPPKPPEPANAKTAPAPRSAAAPAPPVDACYCSLTTPDCDPAHWKMLVFDLEDGDWDYQTAEFLFAKDPSKKVGIGTKKPLAKLHVEQEMRGRLLFNPDESTEKATGYAAEKGATAAPATDPELRLERDPLPDCDPCFFSQNLSENWATLTTSADSGFSFEHADGPAPLASITPTGMGVLTKHPAAALDVQAAGIGQFLAHPTGAEKATARLVNGRDGEPNTHFSQEIDADFASFSTDAGHGFRFLPEGQMDAKSGGQPVVVMDENGHVGIGTEHPEGHLEVKNDGCGHVVAFLENANPALAVVNSKPTGKATYLTTGADNSFAVLKTDAPSGFVFKRGDCYDPADSNGAEKNLTGEPQVFIDENGSVGIGRQPNCYELDLAGSSRSFEAYLNTNEKTIKNPRPIEHALDSICRLKPIRFEWRSPGAALKKGPHFGLSAEECADFVPEVVKETAKEGHAIAYQNLVPLLVKAVQEQQKTIDHLLARVTALEKRK